MNSDVAPWSRVLVAGGGGFIGSHLVRTILRDHPEAEVVIIDSFVTGRRQNIADLHNREQLTVIEHDLTDLFWLQGYLARERDFSLILHFASPASPPRYQEHPVMTYQVNAFTTHVFAQYCAQRGARMVFASTSEVYGDPLVHPQPESYWGNVNPNGIRSCYDESKRMGETVCGVHVREMSADIRLLRIFNTYGPQMDPFDGRVIPSFALAALQGQPLPIFGDGSQTRSFCYVDDLVTGILLYAQKPNLAGETINLGNPNEFTLRELVDVLGEVLGVGALACEYLPLPGDDPTRRRPVIQKAQQLLGWEPRVSLRDGLGPTIASFREALREQE